MSSNNTTNLLATHSDTGKNSVDGVVVSAEARAVEVASKIAACTAATNQSLASLKAAAQLPTIPLSLENTIAGNEDEGSDRAFFSPPCAQKNRVTAHKEVDFSAHNFSNSSPAATTMPQHGENRKKPKTVSEIGVGDVIDYWAPATTAGTKSNLRRGMITVIYYSKDWDDNENMYDIHLMVDMDPVTYGSKIRLMNTNKWIVTSWGSCKFIEGVWSGGLIASVDHVSNHFKQITETARNSFTYCPSSSYSSSDSDDDNEALDPDMLDTPTSTETSSPQFSPPQFSLQNDDECPVQSFYNDQSLLPTGSRMGFIMTIAVGVVEDFKTTVVDDDTTFIPPHPYSYFLSGKHTGFNKSKFTIT